MLKISAFLNWFPIYGSSSCQNSHSVCEFYPGLKEWAVNKISFPGKREADFI
jgi:hypothetical protein